MFDDLNIGGSDEMNIRFWENTFQSAISIERRERREEKKKMMKTRIESTNN